MSNSTFVRRCYATVIALIFIFFAQISYGQNAPAGEKEKSTGIDIIITQSPKIIVKVEAVTDNKCFAESKGAINISASGGYPPYKYHWSHGDTTQDVAGLKAGKYRVAVYDNFSCSDTLTIEIKQPEKLLADIESVKDILCYGYKNGEVNINVSGGKPPYTYSWNNGETTQDLKEVNSGRYSVLITDANSCQEIITADVEEKPLIVRSLDDVQNILCHGDTTGKVDITVSGGVPPYTYLWNNGTTTEDLAGVIAGTYDVTVKDSEGCTEVSTTKVVEPAALSLSFDEVRNLSCFGDLGGAINIKVEGGKVPYTYKWNNGLATQDIAGIPAGKYHVDVTDKNGCKAEISTEISQPNALLVNLKNSKNISYYGGEDGAIDIEATGGIPPYVYKWNNGSENQDLSGLKSGSYTVRVTDASGCAKIMNVTLTQPTPLIAKLDNTKDISCYGTSTGEINISVLGGVPPYKYVWSNGATTQDVANLPAGDYSVRVIDANNHEQLIEASLSQPDEFTAQIVGTTDIKCNSNNTGAIDLEVQGGVLPYKYRWSNGQSTQDLTNVLAGSYSVKVIDANFCELELSASISEPDPLELSFENITHINCFGQSTGAIDLTVTGGASPYKYAWNNGSDTQDLKSIKAGEYSVNVTDANGCVKVLSTTINEPQLLSLKENSVQNIDCKGNSTGSISIEVFGGVKPYSYAWNNGAASKDISNLTAGDYSVKVTDANGCTTSYSKTITEPAQLVRSLEDVTNILCYGDLKGAININVSGGVEPYSYRWSNGAMTQDVVNLKAGNYSVMIRDANGCTDSLSATVKENPRLTATAAVTDIKCYGQKSGAVNLSVAGGVAPYTYLWSNEATSQSITQIGAGNYSVSVKDSKGCQINVDATVSEPPRFIASLESDTDILCNGENTGSVSVRVSGGVTPYNFKWSNGETTQNLTNTAAGDYTLTATDANGCLQTVSTTLTQPSAIDFSVKSVTNVLCYGDNGGAIDISVAGGVGPFTYKWSNGATTQDLETLKAGKYSVQIVDANGCAKTLDAEVTQPELLSLNIDSVVNISCHGDLTGSIDLNVEGGVAPYKYSWSNGSSTQDISKLPAGNYSVTVTDAHGCSKTIGAAVKQPPLLAAKITDVKDILCYGNETGAISIDVIGGVKPYKFKWSSGETTQNLVDVVAGNYTVEITDQMGCSQTLSAIITQPTKLTASLASVNDVSCFEGSNGAVNITVVGGTAPYKYSWSNEASTQDLENVVAGRYQVKIVDQKGCKDSAIIAEVKEPTLLEVKLNGVTNIQQYGQHTGAIDITVSGGVAPYIYSWSNGATTQDISKVPGGDYSVNVRDANGCEKRVDASILQPPPLVLTIQAQEDIMCYGDKTGSIDIDVKGGVPPYKFAWSNGKTTQNIADVAAGDYTVTVTDANGHQQSMSTKIAQPSQLLVKLDDVNNLRCFNDGSGSISVTTTGGIAPYKYSWNSGQTAQDIDQLSAGDYTLTVTDSYNCQNILQTKVTQPDSFKLDLANINHINCFGQAEGDVSINVSGGTLPYSFNWSNGERSKDIENVLAGEYSIRVNDANGCENTMDVKIEQPTELVASIGEVNNNLCSGESKGSISLSISGGSTPYTFAWSNGATTQDISDLPSGKYSVSITDAKGCTRELFAEITEPELLMASISDVSNVNCFGNNTGSISVDVSGGVVPYSYIWNNGSAQKNLIGIPAGDYQMSVKDGNGCVKTVSTTITQPDVLSLGIDSINHVLCYGDNKGFIDINVTGGVYPYNYTWSNGSQGEDLVNALSGTYSVKVKDVNGCEETLQATIEQPANLLVTLDSINNISCSGDETGYVRIKANGGKAPYSYLWNNGVTSNELKNVVAGIYRATITDANGCITTFETEITQPSPLVKTIDAITDIRCNSDSTGAIQVSVMEGVQPYSFSWSNGAATEDIRGLTAGNYKLTITEGNGCQSVLEATIEEPPAFYASIDEVVDVNCYGAMTGSIDISASGGVEPYMYAWSNGAETQDISEIGADSYSVMVTDGNGCLNTLNAEIVEPPLLTLRIDSVHNVKCCGDNSGAIFITVEGGVKPYKYDWSHGATTEDIENLVLGVYTVNVTDANGCVVTTPDDMTLYEQVVSKGRFTTRDILFDVGKSIIKPESFTTINRIATFMKEHPDISFRIDGHTDSDGSAESNQQLSLDRARAIRLALIKFGIRENRLDTKGFGESSPLVPNTTAENKSLNRRVEFIALTGTIEGTKIESEGVQLQD